MRVHHMNENCKKLERATTGIISFGFVIWSIAFIHGSSFVAIDGKRYFCLFDDAMISMRYAWNFSHGEGLVWNSGEYIQGYTNLLMTLLMSLSTLAFDKSTAALFIQISGVGFMLAIAYTTMRIADHFIRDESLQRQTFIRIIAFLCPLTYYPLAYWALMGMETGLLTMLCLVGVLAALNYTRNNSPKLLALVVVSFGLAFLTRNDSIIFAALTWLYIAQDRLRLKEGNRSFPPLLWAIALYLLFVVGQEIFQYTYYGELLPNTYTLKLTGMPLLDRIRNGVGFTTYFLIETAFILIVSTLHTFVTFRKQELLLMSIAFSAIGYQIYVGGDPWDYWRILSPSMPLLFVLYTCAIYSFVNHLLNSSVNKGFLFSHPMFTRLYVNEGITFLLILMGLFSVDIKFLPEMLLLKKPYEARGNEEHVNIALLLSQITRSDASVGVIWAGSIPYYSGRRAIDFLGKCDRYVARLPPDLSGKVSWRGMTSVPGHNKYDLDYSIKALHPTYVERFSWGSQNLKEWAKGRYVAINYNGVSVFLLKDSPAVLWVKIDTLAKTTK